MDYSKLFPDHREQGETPLRQCQLVMLRMLKILDYICIKHQINYFLIGGSLIGAIRHKGFIPWDDDLDICMTRDNYEKFIKHGVPELPKDIFFQNAQTDKFYSQTCNVDARLRDKYSRYVHTDSKVNKHHEGFQIDIFVHDRSFLPNNLYVITLNKLLKLLNNSERRAQVLKFIDRYIPLPKVYSSNYLKNYNARNMGTFLKHKELANLQRTSFEDMEVYIPEGYDSYLKRQFGNYMELPPIEKRISNHFVIPDPFSPCNHTEILYWKDKNIAIESNNK